MQRRAVDFPDPDCPMIAATCPRSTSKVTPFKTSTAPKDLRSSRISTIGDIEFPFQSTRLNRKRITDEEIEQTGQTEVEERLETGVIDDLGVVAQLGIANDER